MKKAVVVAVVSVVVGLGGYLFPGFSFDTVSTADTVKAEFSVERLSCGSCVETIRQAVSAVDGVRSVTTDLSLNQTRVEFDPDKTDVAAIATTITESGYPAQLFAKENAAGEMVTDVDTDLYVARIGKRLVARTAFNDQVERQRTLAAESGQVLPVQYMIRFAWMSILQRELLLAAAEDAGIIIANPELDAYVKENRLPSTDREQARDELLLDLYFKQQNLDASNNPAQLSSLLQTLQQQTRVQIFDGGLKQNLARGTGQGSGCGGGCCG